ncbi:hypothetical protein [Sorangium sp. So ce693]|uniref:hypothetical protein n=1 Tax=Sorangium sp. So ce693 TaxID=3133318 RepID=UPI003F5E1435
MPGEDRGWRLVWTQREQAWPDGLGRVVTDTVAEFTRARGIAQNEDNAMAATLLLVFVALEIALQSGVPRVRVFNGVVQMLAHKTGAELLEVPLQGARGSGREKPS